MVSKTLLSIQLQRAERTLSDKVGLQREEGGRRSGKGGGEPIGGVLCGIGIRMRT